jgi:hypothetical protein
MYLNKWKRSLNHFRLGYLSSTAHRLLTRSRPTSNQPMASAHKDRARAPGPTGTARRFSRPRPAATGSRRPCAPPTVSRPYPLLHPELRRSTSSFLPLALTFLFLLAEPPRSSLHLTVPTTVVVVTHMHEAFALTSCAHHRVVLPTNAATNPSHRTASATAPLHCGHHVDGSRIW